MSRMARRFQIRVAGPQDASGILLCLEAAFAAYQNDYTAEAFEDTVLNPATLQKRLQYMHILVAASEGGIVGTIGYQVKGRTGYLRGMAVVPEWQGSGVAGVLLSSAEVALRSYGCTSVTLGTTDPLKRAMLFYRRHGFYPSGIVTDFYGMELCEYRKPLSAGIDEQSNDAPS